MQPSEFWELSPTEYWLEFDWRYEQQQAVTPGLGGHTQAEWAAARRKHRKKQHG